MVVKLKNLKFCIPIQLGIPIVPFFGEEEGVWAITPHNIAQFCTNFHQM